eukprot:gene313-175_t
MFLPEATGRMPTRGPTRLWRRNAVHFERGSRLPLSLCIMTYSVGESASREFDLSPRSLQCLECMPCPCFLFLMTQSLLLNASPSTLASNGGCHSGIAVSFLCSTVNFGGKCGWNNNNSNRKPNDEIKRFVVRPAMSFPYELDLRIANGEEEGLPLPYSLYSRFLHLLSVETEVKPLIHPTTENAYGPRPSGVHDWEERGVDPGRWSRTRSAGNAVVVTVRVGQRAEDVALTGPSVWCRSAVRELQLKKELKRKGHEEESRSFFPGELGRMHRHTQMQCFGRCIWTTDQFGVSPGSLDGVNGVAPIDAADFLYSRLHDMRSPLYSTHIAISDLAGTGAKDRGRDYRRVRITAMGTAALDSICLVRSFPQGSSSPTCAGQRNAVSENTKRYLRPGVTGQERADGPFLTILLKMILNLGLLLKVIGATPLRCHFCLHTTDAREANTSVRTRSPSESANKINITDNDAFVWVFLLNSFSRCFYLRFLGFIFVYAIEFFYRL